MLAQKTGSPANLRAEPVEMPPWGPFSKQDRIARFDHGRVGYAVGDIHGRSDLLAEALERIERDAGRRAHECAPALIFLGDYIDRGPDSMGVLDLLCTRRLAGFETHFLKGNHEAAMLAFLEAPAANRAWLAHGGLETMVSYGVQPLPSIAAPDEAVVIAARRLRMLAPEAHLSFLRSLERFFVIGDYVFVHAGLDGDRPLAKQDDQDLFWARKRFLADRRRYSHVIVHGHTPVDAPYCDDRRICLDTGAYLTGDLSVGRFEGERADVMRVRIDGGAGAYWTPLR